MLNWHYMRFKLKFKFVVNNVTIIILHTSHHNKVNLSSYSQSIMVTKFGILILFTGSLFIYDSFHEQKRSFCEWYSLMLCMDRTIWTSNKVLHGILKPWLCTCCVGGLIIQSFQNNWSSDLLGGWTIPEKSVPFENPNPLFKSPQSILMVIANQWCML